MRNRPNFVARVDIIDITFSGISKLLHESSNSQLSFDLTMLGKNKHLRNRLTCASLVLGSENAGEIFQFVD